MYDSLIQELIIEVRRELAEISEDYIIKEASEEFEKLLMSGPYKITAIPDKDGVPVKENAKIMSAVIDTDDANKRRT